MYYPGQKDRYSQNNNEVDLQFDHVISCNIDFDDVISCNIDFDDVISCNIDFDLQVQRKLAVRRFRGLRRCPTEVDTVQYHMIELLIT